MATKRILVTGGNAGIGLALCKQLAVDHGCHVLLSGRSKDRGQKAVQGILSTHPKALVTFIECDVSDDKSVVAAAKSAKEVLGGEPLYAIVNNAGVGLGSKATEEMVIDTNYFGVKRVTTAFLPLLDSKQGRIVTTGSGAGPMFVAKQVDSENEKAVKVLTSWDTTEEELDRTVAELAKQSDGGGFYAYGLSKAAATVYTMILAKRFRQKEKQPNGIRAACLTPGFIATKMTKGMGASKSPEEGTVSLLHCLFNEIGNGYFYGSDALRSPLTALRNPGEPVYKGSDADKPFQF